MKALKVIFIVLAIPISIGLVFQFYSTSEDLQRFNKDGALIDIGGYGLYVVEKSAQTPSLSSSITSHPVTILFDSGMGDELSVWNQVVELLPPTVRVITYDRAGLGWSDESPLPRETKFIVDELHTLITQLEVKEPIILVGHSFGGINVQQYALRYPNDIAGLVLIDSAHEEQLVRMPPNSALRKLLYKFGMWAAPVGIPRLYLSNSNPVTKAKKSTVKHQYTSLDEAAMFETSIQNLKAANPDFAGLPLTVIARQNPSSKTKKSDGRDYTWALLQEEIASRSTNSRLIFSGQKQHSIQRYQPDIVANAITDMVDRL